MILLDFEACGNYSKEFVDKYIKIINSASEEDRNKVLTLSREIEFLTGYESKIKIYVQISCTLCIKVFIVK